MLKITEFRNDRAYPTHDTLFERVRHFRFTPPSGGHLTTGALPVGSLTVAEVRSAGHDIALDTCSEFSFLAPASGRIRVEKGGAGFEAAAGGALMLRSGERTTSVRADGAQEFRAVVAVARQRRPAVAGRTPGRAMPRIATHPEARGLAGFLDYLLREAALAGSPLLRPTSLKAAEALILDAMRALDRFDAPLRAAEAASVSARRVKAAEEFMRAHLDEPLTVEAIAGAVGVGSRTLLSAFRDRLDTTPRELLSRLRLERARALLLAAEAGTSVTEIALECGFAHLGRFAGAYCARYGESPSETLRSARGEG